jgi:hypothetical protein
MLLRLLERPDPDGEGRALRVQQRDRDDGDAYPEPVALAEGRRITFCGGVVDEPCSPAEVFGRR